MFCVNVYAYERIYACECVCVSIRVIHQTLNFTRYIFFFFFLSRCIACSSYSSKSLVYRLALDCLSRLFSEQNVTFRYERKSFNQQLVTGLDVDTNFIRKFSHTLL